MVTASDRIRRARPLLGTFVEITVAGSAKPEMEAAVNAAFDAMSIIHRLMSFHEQNSDVSRLNREAGVQPVRVHAWTYQVLEAAVDLHRRSKGVFDIAVAPVLQAMGLLPNTEDNPSDPAKLPCFDAIELLSKQTVRFQCPGMKIDLGGIAKGFAVDRAIEILREFNLSNGLVNAGGDLAAFGREPQTIQVRNPRDQRRMICDVILDNEALASTGRRFDPVQSADAAASAVIDPSTRAPARMVDGATVCASSCMVADALTKLVMIAGLSATELLEHYNASALLVSADGDVHITADWHNRVYLAA